MSVYEVLSIYAKLTKLRRSLQRRIRRRHPFLSLSTKLNLCIESRYCWKDYWKDVHRYVCHAFRDDHYPVRGCPRLSNGGGPLTHTPLATTASPTEKPNPNNQPETQLHSPTESPTQSPTRQPRESPAESPMDMSIRGNSSWIS